MACGTAAEEVGESRLPAEARERDLGIVHSNVSEPMSGSSIELVIGRVLGKPLVDLRESIHQENAYVPDAAEWGHECRSWHVVLARLEHMNRAYHDVDARTNGSLTDRRHGVRSTRGSVEYGLAE